MFLPVIVIIMVIVIVRLLLLLSLLFSIFFRNRVCGYRKGVSEIEKSHLETVLVVLYSVLVLEYYSSG